MIDVLAMWRILEETPVMVTVREELRRMETQKQSAQQSRGLCLEGHNQRAIQSALENQKLCPICMQNLLRRWLSTYGVAEVLPPDDDDKLFRTRTNVTPDLTALVDDTRKVLGR